MSTTSLEFETLLKILYEEIIIKFVFIDAK